ncbi:zinc finger BED domain-containing protein 1-like [Acyrthosiphon pisum]|uniref:BED-type domain-containing protein n=1 Tax=Acyrthosiphon pisum TaxID=7029 RepID=A0A8R2AZL8_ACYPI|nr:zinc finger BED domain-containing protein 1-like [Acyrthosiphon pisum]|eukprot:XP_008180150.1 PREDICTED: zinc finger BED domain-containing protein 1-like [Acyrthosiphon pisum]
MSEVWQVFDKSMCGQRAICSICYKSYANSGTNTTNLWSHLKSRHGNKYLELDHIRRGLSITNVSAINPQEDANIDLDGPSTSKLVLKQPLLPTTKKGNVISNQSLMSSFTLTKASQTKIDAALAYFIAVDMMPYNIVAKEGFKLYTKALNSSYNIPSRKTITDSKIPKMYNETKTNIESIINNTYFSSFTTDCWTSGSNKPFLALTGSVCLGCVELSEDHTGENMADTLQLLLLDYNLSVPSNNVCAFTTDYGANMLKAIQNLRVPHVPCFGYAFNTAVGNIFKLEDIQIVIHKVQSIQNIFSYSWQATRELEIEQERFSLKKIKLPSYSKTRWWSLLDLILVVLDQELGLSSFLKTYKKGHYKKLILSDEEIDVLKCTTTVLKPVREITDHLAGENYVTASAIYPVIFNLKTKLSEAVNANNNENASDNKCKEIKTKIFSCIITVLDKRYDNNTVLQISMVLDPRFKTTFIASEEVVEIKKNIIEKCLKSWTEWSTNTRTGITSDEANSVLPLDIPNQITQKKKKTGFSAIFYESINNENDEETEETILSKIEKELQLYVEFSKVPYDQDPLKWWSLNNGTYPLLSILAKKYLSIQATSVAS